MEDRWERLFADIESQSAARPDEDEIAALVEAERVSVTAADRVAGSLGAAVTVLMRSGARHSGTIAQPGDGWFLLTDPTADRVIALAHVAGMGPLGAPRPAGRLLGLAAVLRRMVGLTAVVEAPAPAGGRILAVGADHLDLADHAGAVTTVMLPAIESVRVTRGSLTGAP